MQAKSSRGRTIAIAAGAALAVALVGALMTDIGSWYQGLQKPPWQPPDIWFGPAWALSEVVLLWLSIVVLMVVCWRRSRIAAWLLLPYLAWVTFASVLNLEIVRLNGPFGAG